MYDPLQHLAEPEIVTLRQNYMDLQREYEVLKRENERLKVYLDQLSKLLTPKP